MHDYAVGRFGVKLASVYNYDWPFCCVPVRSKHDLPISMNQQISDTRYVL